MKQRHPFYRKVIVVTGAASGIGLAVCHRFAADGAVVAMLDMDADALAAASAGLTVKGARVSTHVCDVTSESQCRDSIGTVIAQHDGIDLLFNNAGITQRGAFIDTETAVFHKVMAVNFFGSLYCTKAALHSLIARHGQIIVNESIAGIAPVLGRTGYSASKHALHGLFTSLRSEIRPTGAHVMIVCPGFIQTNLQRRALGCDGRVTKHPQSRVGRQQTPEQAADAIYQGARRRRNMVVLTPVGKFSYWLSRLAPVLFERIQARQLAQELNDHRGNPG